MCASEHLPLILLYTRPLTVLAETQCAHTYTVGYSSAESIALFSNPLPSTLGFLRGHIGMTRKDPWIMEHAH